MRPPPRSAAAFWIVREQADFNCLKPLFESTQTRAFVATAPPKPTYAGKLLLILPEGGEVHTDVYETIRREPRVPDLEQRVAGAVRAGRHGRVGFGRGGRRHGPLAQLQLRRDGDEGGGPRGHRAAQRQGSQRSRLDRQRGAPARRPQAGRRRPRRLRRRQPIRRRRQPWRRGRQPRASLVAAAGQTATLYTERLWR